MEIAGAIYHSHNKVARKKLHFLNQLFSVVDIEDVVTMIPPIGRASIPSDISLSGLIFRLTPED